MPVCVAYSCNEAYIHHTGISILSLLENNKDIPELKIYFIEKDVTKSSIGKLDRLVKSYNREFTILSFNELCNDLEINATGRHIETIYAKLFFTRIKDADKILYTDSDTIFNGSLRELWEYDMTNYCVAGVETYTAELKGVLGLGMSDNFINDGVVLMNLDECRKFNLLQKSKDCIAEFNGDPPLLSEGVLNKICRGKIKRIHPKFNMMSGLFEFKGNRYFARDYYDRLTIKEAITAPIIIHYLSAFYNRPWDVNCTHPLRDRYLYYKSRSGWSDIPMENRMLSKKIRFTGLLYKYFPHEILDFIQFINNRNRYKN